jgi:hypothetical protein
MSLEAAGATCRQRYRGQKRTRLLGRGMYLGNVAPRELQDRRFTSVRFVRADQDGCSRRLCLCQRLTDVCHLIPIVSRL